ncbi:hypothetical protein J2801_002142 [Paraburkholderia phenoliruptrix]|uniref:hypothetical protein n=1 Tax=Paraburkholderia phenoliruptrix TaxID=252970 RepID=UPI00285E062C|nr:hypothetical protein [Paraburkholderia phenoliruptrix]MDR6419891.1 hypothetical protein [Paraburkholderia phenoliruptrix]
MANKTICGADQFDAKEVRSLLDEAFGLSASATVFCVDTAAIFEAIAAAAASGSLLRRLADLGMSFCETQGGEFNRQQTAYAKRIERFEQPLHGRPDGAMPNREPADQINQVMAECSHAGVRS